MKKKTEMERQQNNIIVASTGDVSHELVIDPANQQQGGRYRGAIIFELMSEDAGTHTVTISSDDHSIKGIPEIINGVSHIRVSSMNGEAEFTVQDDNTNEKISFVSVPVPVNNHGGIIGLAGITTQNHTITSNDYPLTVLGDGISTQKVFDQYVVYGNSTYTGTIISGMLEPYDLHSSSADVGTNQDNKDIVLDIPDTIRVNEPFPYYFHVFENGVPKQPNTHGRISLPDVFEERTNNEITVSIKSDEIEDYKITVISDVGTATETVEVVSGLLEVDTRLSNEVVNVGEGFVLELTSFIQDIVYNVISEIPYEQTDEDDVVLSFKPTREGNFDIDVTGKRSGYEDYNERFTVNVENILDVVVESTGLETVEFDLIVGLDTINNGTVTPYGFRTDPASISIQFPSSYIDISTDSGYTFEYMEVGPTREFNTVIDDNTYEINLSDTDLYVMAHYTRDVNVMVLGGSGTGVYEQGDIVTIQAVDTEIVPFLVYERFDGWDTTGQYILVGATETFPAEHDVIITAKYYTDHTRWMLLIGIAVISIISVITLKRSTKVSFALKNILPSKHPKITGG